MRSHPGSLRSQKGIIFDSDLRRGGFAGGEIHKIGQIERLGGDPLRPGADFIRSGEGVRPCPIF